MSNVAFVAGSVNGVYPRPVEGDRLEDVLSFVAENKDWTVAFVFVTNGFDADGNYVHMRFKDATEEESYFYSARNPLFRESQMFQVESIKRYGRDCTATVYSDSVSGIIQEVAKVSTGTMNVTFNKGYGRSPEQVATFNVAVG
jgi:hypothetical protein